VPNQFGTGQLDVTEALLLYPPAAKAIGDAEPGEPPRLDDHHLCYGVEARAWTAR
jgi:hypothetical protein